MRKLKMILTIIYLLSPIDLIPEALLGPIGLLDDGGAFLYLIATFFSDDDKQASEKYNNVKKIGNNLNDTEYSEKQNTSSKKSQNGNKILIYLLGMMLLGVSIYAFRDKLPIINKVEDKTIGTTIQEKDNKTYDITQKLEKDYEKNQELESKIKNGKYMGTERNQFVVINGKSVYIDENGRILE